MSAATVYKTYGGKAGLLRELCDRALLGGDTVPAQARSDALRVGDDPLAVVAGRGALAAEVSPRVSPLVLLLRTTAETDREAAALYAELDNARLHRMAENARYLADGGDVPPGVTADEARDVLWLCASPELYDLMVVKRVGLPSDSERAGRRHKRRLAPLSGDVTPMRTVVEEQPWEAPWRTFRRFADVERDPALSLAFDGDTNRRCARRTMPRMAPPGCVLLARLSNHVESA